MEDKNSSTLMHGGLTPSTATQRVFFAFWPSAEAADQIADWARHAHAVCGGRMMRPESLHMTLAFLGSIPVDKVTQLIQAAPAWSIPVGTVELRHFGRFYGPRVVWLGPSIDDSDRIQWLDEAYATLWDHLEPLGWQRPASVFRPHVSLLRKAGAGDLTTLPQPNLRWTPVQCVLVVSRPSTNGSHYEVLARLPTAPPAG
ncbi:RNA 2',3'-cyclic phosphodiesterase [Candidimonas sp. SYP-B2681]|uniref:RNA 2',3'-cyclic phosphodiesterase n=1 Tax=Candidimonas sp. SYP-B2681 TaxID=2497686 RepID=UPI000F88B203|nr:RNA 2',3'-cyclic phosphodiesterase [Candidimonas sp. SYP-B2681]RTZ43296.1 RNA 2',3'-cyclic phosphodiesterase [Candidimonas sp. SYP-B2681]